MIDNLNIVILFFFRNDFESAVKLYKDICHKRRSCRNVFELQTALIKSKNPEL